MLNRRLLLGTSCAVLCLVALIAHAVPLSPAWTRQFGTSVFDGAGGVSTNGARAYVAGSTEGTFDGETNQGLSDAFVRAYGSAGTVLWTDQLGTAQADLGRAAAATSSGVYVAGDTGGVLPTQASAGGTDAFVSRYDPNGVPLWTRQFGTSLEERGFGVAATPTAVYVVGHTAGTFSGEASFGNTDAFIRKYDAQGVLVWTTQFGSGLADQAVGVSLSGTGVYVAGHTNGALVGQSSAGGQDAWAARFDTSGNPVWTKQFGTPSLDAATGIAVAGNAVYVSGSTEGTMAGQTSSGDPDAFVRRLSTSGATVWTRQFGTASSEEGRSIAATTSGAYVIGVTLSALPGETSAGSHDAFVRHYRPDGTTPWTDQFGSSGSDTGAGVASGGAGVFAVGSVLGGAALPGQTSAGGQDVYLRRYVSYRPDGRIALARSGRHAGDGVYNTTGIRQTKTVRKQQGRTQTFYLRFQNDGEATDSFMIKGCRSGGGFRVAYLAGATGNTGITNAVVRGNYRLNQVAPGASRSIRMKITVKASAPDGALKTCAVRATSVAQMTRQDTVKGRVRAR